MSSTSDDDKDVIESLEFMETEKTQYLLDHAFRLDQGIER